MAADVRHAPTRGEGGTWRADGRSGGDGQAWPSRAQQNAPRSAENRLSKRGARYRSNVQAGTLRTNGEREPGNIRAGAGDGTRTRDALLGRQVLYQLSYSRVGNETLAGPLCPLDPIPHRPPPARPAGRCLTA